LKQRFDLFLRGKFASGERELLRRVDLQRVAQTMI